MSWEPKKQAGSGLLHSSSGLLAFLYDVYTSKKSADEFKNDPLKVMNQYDLTAAEQHAVLRTGLDPTPKLNKDLLKTVKNSKVKGSVIWPKARPKDRARPDKRSMGVLCMMLVAYLCDPDAYEITW